MWFQGFNVWPPCWHWSLMSQSITVGCVRWSRSSQFFHVYVHMVCMHVCMYVTELVNMCVQMCEMCLCLWRFKVGVLCPPRSQWFTLHIEPRACCWLLSLYSLPRGVSVSSELWSKAGHHTHLAFKRALGTQTQVLLLEWQELYRSSYLPGSSPHLFEINLM